MINPNLLDLDLEGSDNVSNAPVVSTIIDNLSFPNEQFYEICSQLNEGQQHLFKKAEKNNELPPKPLQIFLREGAGVGKSFLIIASSEISNVEP